MRYLLLALLVACLVACAAPSAPPTATASPLPSATPSPAPSATVVAIVPTETAAPPTRTPLALRTPAPGEALFDGAAAMAHAQAQCDIGPRPAGSEALLATRDYIETTLQAAGWEVVRQDGEFQGVPIHNVIGVKGEGVPRMVGAHYDTRPVADRDPTSPQEPIIGANDGASGVAVLLELARTLDIPEGRQVQLAFYDAEDRGNLEGWPFSVGARQMAADLPVERPEAVVVLDMIGDADQQIFRENGSNQDLNNTLFAIAEVLGFTSGEEGFFNQGKYLIIDDHLPFLEQGIPAADLIDFDYPYWHTTEDTCDKLGEDSLYRVGRVVEVWLEQ